MAKLLIIQAHPKTDGFSYSLDVAQTFIDSYLTYNPTDTVTIRNVFTDGVPPINDLTFDAWMKMKQPEKTIDILNTAKEQATKLAQHFKEGDLMNELEANIVDTMTFLRYGDPLERNQKWLLKQIDTPELQELAEKLSILSSQVLNEIARNNNQSAADIANELNVTRGGISQVAKRL